MMCRKFFAVLVLILSIFLLSLPMAQAKPMDLVENLRKTIEDSLSPGKPGWQSWDEGIKEDYKGELKRIHFSITVMSEESNDTHTMLTLNFTFTGFFLNKAGDKERLVLVRVMAILCDKKTGEVVQAAIISEDRKTAPGWNGRDC